MSDDRDEWDIELDQLAEHMRMALAEAGYPDADVWNGGTGVFVKGPPQDVIDKAAAVCGCGTVDLLHWTAGR